MGVGVLDEVGDLTVADRPQMRERCFERARGAGPAIGSERKDPVVPRRHDLVRHRRKVLNVAADWPEHVGRDFAKAAIDAAVRQALRFGPMRVGEQLGKLGPVAGRERLVEVCNNFRSFRHVFSR